MTSSLWSHARLSQEPSVAQSAAAEERTPFERDYDRILFSAPVRRMADKTQVFPLDRNDSVRTRLTHSHEVANLARSIGTRLARMRTNAFGSADADAAAPTILAAVGLAHDLGNPPFGHQGEVAIQEWFRANDGVFSIGDLRLSDRQINDFCKFEGNAQTLRILTRLQVTKGEFGLDLTAATLAAVVKYPVPSDKIDKSHVSSKKYGYFQSEDDVLAAIHARTGLRVGQRHPLAFLMEACDDIAYCVLDVEDAVKKGIISSDDVLSWLSRTHQADSVIEFASKLKTSFDSIDSGRSPSERNDIAIQLFRVHAIDILMVGLADAFIRRTGEIFSGEHDTPLMSEPGPLELRDALQSLALKVAYRHPTVLELELQGSTAVAKLMEIFWRGIRERGLGKRPDGSASPFGKLVYELISDNYRRLFEDTIRSCGGDGLAQRYAQLRLLTDMISGMSDSFAMSMYERLSRYA